MREILSITALITVPTVIMAVLCEIIRRAFHLTEGQVEAGCLLAIIFGACVVFPVLFIWLTERRR